MIEGFNPSSLNLSEEEFTTFAERLSDAADYKEVLENLQKRRENAVNGGVNCIPFPFKRFRSEIPGVEQGQYVLVTANQKVGKSSLASFLYIYNVLDYCYENPDKCSVHIIYFALEESKQRVIERYMSHLLYKLNKIRMSPQDLRSTSVGYPVPQTVLDLFQEEEYQKRLEFFNKCVQFETENTNPTGILRVCEEYAKSVGDFKQHTEKSNGLAGNSVKIFDSYIQRDPNHYKIMFIDHVSLVDKEQGFSNKQAVDKVSEYCVKYLRNRYNYTCVVIQQQASETEGLEAIKMKKMMPSTSGLSDSKYTSRDSNLVLGLFDPSKFGLSTWLQYKIQEPGTNKGLKNYGRFLYVLANRDGEMGGICPLFFDGAVTNFEELPKPDGVEIEKYYTLADKLRSFRQQSKLEQLKSAVLSFFIKKFKNKK